MRKTKFHHLLMEEKDKMISKISVRIKRFIKIYLVLPLY